MMRFTIHSSHFFFLLTPRPPTSTLFPYTTLFRSFTVTLTNNLPTGVGNTSIVFQGATVTATGGTAGLLKTIDRKSTRLNSSHVSISYAVFCLKKKNNEIVSG